MPSHHSPKPGRSAFALLLLVTFAVFAVSLALLVVLAEVWTHPTTVQMQVIDTIDYTVNLTAGTIVGLLGGKLTT